MRLINVLSIVVLFVGTSPSLHSQAKADGPNLQVNILVPKVEIVAADLTRAGLGQPAIRVRVTNDSDQSIVSWGGVVIKLTDMDDRLAMEGPLASVSHFFSPHYHQTRQEMLSRGSTVLKPHFTDSFSYGINGEYVVSSGVPYKATAYYCIDPEQMHCREGNTVVLSF
jgi:hypothetical protein